MATATSTDIVPREPSAYTPSMHFSERFHDRYEDDRPPRHLDDEIVRGCIERGDARKINAEKWWLEETFGGVTYRLVVTVPDMDVITGYPIQCDRDVAWASGRWSSQQLDDIEAFIATDPR